MTLTQAISKFVTSDPCASCGRSEEDANYYHDVVGLALGEKKIVICGACSLKLVDLLLDRFYPVWGQVRMNGDLEKELYSLFDSIGSTCAEAIDGVKILRKLLDAQQQEITRLEKLLRLGKVA